MRRNTKGVLTNPPASRWGKKQAAKKRPAARKPRQKRRGSSAAAPIPATRLGTPVEIVYRHVHGGTYRHRFDRGSQLLHTDDGSALIVTGVNVKAFIEG
jgi:hypothetical protein